MTSVIALPFGQARPDPPLFRQSQAAVWTPTDFGDFTLEFDTVLVGSHVVSGTSDLLDYAVANGTVVKNSGGGLQVYTIPAADAVIASQG